MANRAAPSPTLDDAITLFRRGEPVLLGGSVLAIAGELASEHNLARLRQLSARRLGVVLTGRRAVALGIAPKDAMAGAVSIAIAADLSAAVIRNLADPAASLGVEPPGLGPKLWPAKAASVAAVTLAKLAALLPAAVVLPLAPAEAALARRRPDLAKVDVGAVMQRHAAMTGLTRVAEARVPLEDAEDARSDRVSSRRWRPRAPGDRDRHARPRTDRCWCGSIPNALPATVLGSLRCDCGEQLRGAIAAIAEAGGGVLLYLAQEGRGIGLVNKLRAYQLQDAGFDTIDANEQLGFDADERVYLPAAEMLRQLGFNAVRLLTNNPEKVAALERYGIAVIERVPHVFPANGHNERYLRTKATRSGHLL